MGKIDQYPPRQNIKQNHPSVVLGYIVLVQEHSSDCSVDGYNFVKSWEGKTRICLISNTLTTKPFFKKMPCRLLNVGRFVQAWILTIFLIYTSQKCFILISTPVHSFSTDVVFSLDSFPHIFPTLQFQRLFPTWYAPSILSKWEENYLKAKVAQLLLIDPKDHPYQPLTFCRWSMMPD